MTATRADVVRVARSYIGTPFRHQAREPGVWLDCAGVIVCAARELELVAPDFDVTGYRRSPDGKSLIGYSGEHMDKIQREDMQPGDVVVLRWGKEPQHFGVVGDYVHGGLSIIHAYSYADGSGLVVEQALAGYQKNIVAAYQLPGLA